MQERKGQILHNADCFDVLPLIEDGTVDMVFADLPYGTTRNRWDVELDLAELWAQLNRVCKETASMVFTCQQPFTTALVASNIRNFRYEWIWEKHQGTGHLNAKRMPMKAHENIAVFYRKLPTYNPQKTFGHKKWSTTQAKSVSTNWGRAVALPGKGDGSRMPRSVLKFASAGHEHGSFGQKTSHPTQKPVELVEYMIETYTNPGDIVLDPTAGVLTTAIAAAKTGRRSIVIEKDSEYFAKGLARFDDEGDQ